jgi:hypothetical protein
MQINLRFRGKGNITKRIKSCILRGRRVQQCGSFQIGKRIITGRRKWIKIIVVVTVPRHFCFISISPKKFVSSLSKLNTTAAVARRYKSDCLNSKSMWDVKLCHSMALESHSRSQVIHFIRTLHIRKAKKKVVYFTTKSRSQQL